MPKLNNKILVWNLSWTEKWTLEEKDKETHIVLIFLLCVKHSFVHTDIWQMTTFSCQQWMFSSCVCFLCCILYLIQTDSYLFQPGIQTKSIGKKSTLMKNILLIATQNHYGNENLCLLIMAYPIHFWYWYKIHTASPLSFSKDFPIFNFFFFRWAKLKWFLRKERSNPYLLDDSLTM